MSVEFVVGRPGAEADAYVNRRIGDMLREDPIASITVVAPRQSTFETASEIFRANDLRGSLTLQVISPRTFVNQILDEVFGSAIDIVDTAGKSMAIRRILDADREMMRAFSRIGAGHQLPTMLAKQISQLRMMDISPEELREYAIDKQNQRLADLAVIYEELPEYLRTETDFARDGRTETRYVERIDGDEQMNLAIGHIAESDLVRNARAIVFRGFSSYSEQMVRLMEQVMEVAPETIVLFSAGPDEGPDSDVYGAGREAVRRLMPKALGRPLTVTRKDDERAARAPEDILHVSRRLFSHTARTKHKRAPSMRIAAAKDPEQEIRAVAAEVVRLHRDEKIPFSRMAIVWGETAAYEVLVRRIFADAHIPYFTDEQKSLAQSNLAEFILTAAELTSGQLKKDALLAHIATGFTALAPDEQSALLNYGQTRVGRGREFQKEFRRDDPREFRDDFEMAERARQKVIGPIISRLRRPLRDGRENDAGSVFAALEAYINEVLRPDRIASKAADLGARFEQASFMEQTYKTAVSIVNQARDMLAGTKLAAGDARRILQAGFEAVMLSVVPAGVDEVQAGQLGGFRVPEVDALFVVGVNDEVLPKFMETPKGILTPQEWAEVVHDIKQIQITSAGDEQKFQIVEAIRQAKRSIQWSYHEEGGLQPSVLIQYLDELFEEPVERVDPERQALFLKQNAYDYAVRQVRAQADGIPLEVNREVSLGVLGDEEFRKRTDTLKASLSPVRAAQPAPPHIKPRKLSATRLGTFYKCPYQHFIKFQIGAWVPRSVDVDDTDTGLYMHGVLKRVSDRVRARGETVKWSDVAEDEFLQMVDESFVEEVHSRQGDDPDPRTSAVLRVIQPDILSTASMLRTQYGKDSLVTLGSEVTFTVLGGTVGGTIDRIDSAVINGETYYSLVDYKSRLRDFSLEQLLAGTDLQLALYLLAIEEMMRANGDAAELLKNKAGLALDPAGHIAGAGFLNTLPGFASTDSEWWKVHEWWKDYRMRGILSVPSDVAERLYGVDSPGAAARQLFAAQMRTSQKGTAYHGTDAVSRIFMPGTTPGDAGLDDILQCTRDRIRVGGDAIRDGHNEILPFRGSKEDACRYCSFRSICGFDEQQPGMRARRLAKPENGFRAMLAAEAAADRKDGDQ